MRRKHTRTNLRFETLERRQMFDGNITATVANGILTIKGDTLNNGVAVLTSSNNVIEVIGLNQGVNPNNQAPLPTTVNGDTRKFFTGITSVNINLNDGHVGTNEGNDCVVVTKLTVTGWVNIDMGTGTDFVGVGQFDNTSGLADSAVNALLGPVHIATGLAINGQAGDDKFVIANATINGAAGPNLIITGTDGADSITLQDVTVVHVMNVSDNGSINMTMDNVTTNRLNIISGLGNDHISLSNSVVKADMNVLGGLGDDTVAFDSVNMGWLALGLSSGDNSVTATDLTVTHATVIAAAGGNNTIDFEHMTGRGISITLGQADNPFGASGNNSVTMNNVSAMGINIAGGLGLGYNHISLTALTLTNGLAISTGNGIDTVTLNNVNVGAATIINTFAGGDTVSLDNVHSRGLMATLGGGADTISLTDVSISNRLAVGGGLGSDTFNDLGGNTFGTLTRNSFETVH